MWYSCLRVLDIDNFKNFSINQCKFIIIRQMLQTVSSCWWISTFGEFTKNKLGMKRRASFVCVNFQILSGRLIYSFISLVMFLHSIGFVGVVVGFISSIIVCLLLKISFEFFARHFLNWLIRLLSSSEVASVVALIPSLCRSLTVVIISSSTNLGSFIAITWFIWHTEIHTKRKNKPHQNQQSIIYGLCYNFW